ELLAERAQSAMLLGRIRSVEAASKRVHEEERHIHALSGTIAELRQRHEQSLKALRAADEQAEIVRLIGHLLRRTAALQDIAEAERGLAQVTAWGKEIEEKHAAAAAVEGRLAQVQVPAAAQLEDIRQLDQRLQIARDRLSVGLRVQLWPLKRLKVS